jgi:hypothetical protein
MRLITEPAEFEGEYSRRPEQRATFAGAALFSFYPGCRSFSYQGEARWTGCGLVVRFTINVVVSPFLRPTQPELQGNAATRVLASSACLVE